MKDMNVIIIKVKGRKIHGLSGIFVSNDGQVMLLEFSINQSYTISLKLMLQGTRPQMKIDIPLPVLSFKS